MSFSNLKRHNKKKSVIRKRSRKVSCKQLRRRVSSPTRKAGSPRHSTVNDLPGDIVDNICNHATEVIACFKLSQTPNGNTIGVVCTPHGKTKTTGNKIIEELTEPRGFYLRRRGPPQISVNLTAGLVNNLKNELKAAAKSLVKTQNVDITMTEDKPIVTASSMTSLVWIHTRPRGLNTICKHWQRSIVKKN